MHFYVARATVMRWQFGKSAGSHFRMPEKRDHAFEVAISARADPAKLFAGLAPQPETFDATCIAGHPARVSLSAEVVATVGGW